MKDVDILPLRTVWTVGHSNRAASEFLELLTTERIEVLADVRRFPGSRLHPQFNGEALAATLAEAGIEYQHFPALGGRRSKRLEGSPNTAWRVEAFNAYADNMLTGEFGEAFAELSSLAADKRSAIMCAEALPWRCHRRLIADQFVARGWRVLDIVGPRQVKGHALPEFARVENGRVTYPGETLF
jgi:uncharacterized protein (DUF488 family)